MFRMWHHAIVLVMVTVVSSRDCPSGCTCVGTIVTCEGLSAFPASAFPETTEVIRLRRSSLSSIPTGAFNGLPHLRTLSIREVAVDVIEPCAFHSLSGLEELEFRNVAANNVQSFALSDMTHVRHVTFENCQMTRLLSLAVHNVTGLASLVLVNVSLDIVHSQAFNDIGNLQRFAVTTSSWNRLSSNAFYGFSDVSRLDLDRVNLTHVGCGVLETLRQASADVTLTDVTLPCPCDNKLLLRDAQQHPDIYRNVTCTSPPNRRGQALVDVCSARVPADSASVCHSEIISQTRPDNCQAVRGTAAGLQVSQFLPLLLLVFSLRLDP